jgi:tetratricopeptide (TPR) repeat protein
VENQESVQSLEETLIKKLDENPTEFSVLNKLGYIYLHSNNLVKSEETYLRSIVIEKDQFEPYVSLGLIFTITGRLSKALYFLLRAKQKDPDAPDLVRSIKEIKEAVLNKDSKLSQEEISQIFIQGEKYFETNNFEFAIYEYLRLECLYPSDENLLIKLGNCFIRNQDLLIAKDYFETVLTINPNNYNAHHYLGLLYNLFSDFEKTKYHISKSLELKPSLADFSGNGKHGYYQKNYKEEDLESCPLCSSNEFKTINVLNQSVSSFNFNIINPLRVWDQCSNCNVIFANPRPIEVAIEKYEFEFFLNTNLIFELDLDRQIFESNVSNERLNLIQKLTSKNTYLDINSDYGIFYENAKVRGLKVTCLENNVLKFSKNKNQEKDIFKVNINNFHSKEKFDVVTLWESLEKNSNLNSIFKKVYDLLEKDGVFAFSFHGLDTYISNALGKNHPVWSYPEYLYFFDTTVVKNALAKVGFKIENIQTISRKYMANVEVYCRK